MSDTPTFVPKMSIENSRKLLQICGEIESLKQNNVKIRVRERSPETSGSWSITINFLISHGDKHFPLFCIFIKNTNKTVAPIQRKSVVYFLERE